MWTEVLKEKVYMRFNLIRFQAIRITIWPKRTKIAPNFFFFGGGGGKSSTTLTLLPMRNCSLRSSGMSRGQNFAFPYFLLFHLFSVFFGGKRFCENSKSPEIISEKVRLGGRKHFFVWNFLWFHMVLAFFSGLFDYIVLILARFPMHKSGVKVVHDC